MSNTPKKLKKDAIAEALRGFSFECKESAQLPLSLLCGQTR